MKNKRNKLFGIIMVLVLGLAAMAGVFATPVAKEADAYNKLSSTIVGYDVAGTYNYVDYGEYPQTLIGEVTSSYLGDNNPTTDIGIMSKLIDMHRTKGITNSDTYPSDNADYNLLTGLAKYFYGSSATNSGTKYTFEINGVSYRVSFDTTTRYYTFHDAIGSYPAMTKVATYSQVVDTIDKYYFKSTTSNYGFWNYSGTERVNDASVQGRTISDSKVYLFKVEPIKWKVLSVDNSTNKLTLISDSILDARTWVDDTSDSRKTFHYSGVQSWLSDMQMQYNGMKVISVENIRNIEKDGAVMTGQSSASRTGYYPSVDASQWETYLSGDAYQKYGTSRTYRTNFWSINTYKNTIVVFRITFQVGTETDQSTPFISFPFWSYFYGGEYYAISNVDEQFNADLDNTNAAFIDYYETLYNTSGSVQGTYIGQHRYSSYRYPITGLTPGSTHTIDIKAVISDRDDYHSYPNWSTSSFYVSFGTSYTSSAGHSSNATNSSYNYDNFYTNASNRDGGFYYRAFNIKEQSNMYEINPYTYSYFNENMMDYRGNKVWLPSTTEISYANRTENGLYQRENTATDYASMVGFQKYNGEPICLRIDNNSTKKFEGYTSLYTFSSSTTDSLGITPMIMVDIDGSKDNITWYTKDDNSGMYYMQGKDSFAPLGSNGTSGSPVRIGYAPTSSNGGNYYPLYDNRNLSSLTTGAAIIATVESGGMNDVTYKIDYSGFPQGGVILAKFFVNNDSEQGYVTPITTTVGSGGSGTTYIQAKERTGLFSSKRFYYLLSNKLYQINDSVIEERTTLYVNPNAADDSGDGFTQGTAVKYFQTALDRAGNGTTIMVMSAMTRQNLLQIGYSNDTGPIYKGNNSGPYALYDQTTYTYGNTTRYYSTVNDRGITVIVKRLGGGPIIAMTDLYQLTLDNFIFDGQDYAMSEPLISCQYTSHHSGNGYYNVKFQNVTIKNYVGIGTNSALTIDWVGSGFNYYHKSPRLYFSNCNFENNSTANGNGGAVYIGAAFYLKVDGCNFANNSAGKAGGALYVGERFYGCYGDEWSYSGLILRNSQFVGNSCSDGNGGAVYLGYKIHNFGTTSYSTDTSNSISYTNNGGYRNFGYYYVVLYNSSFEDNSCSGNGGAVYSTAYLYDINSYGNCTFRRNHAGGSGGALYTTTGYGSGVPYFGGGGDYSGYAPTTVFDNNSASGRGMAIYTTIDFDTSYGRQDGGGSITNPYHYIYSAAFINHNYSGSGDSEVVYVELNKTHSSVSNEHHFQIVNCAFQNNISTDCAGLRIVYNQGYYNVRIAYCTFGSYSGDTSEGGGYAKANEGKSVLDVSQSGNFSGNKLRFDSSSGSNSSNPYLKRNWLNFCYNKVSDALVNLDFSNSSNSIELGFPSNYFYLSNNQKLHEEDTMKILKIALGSNGAINLSSINISNVTTSGGYLVDITAGDNFTFTAGLTGSYNVGADAVYHISAGNNCTFNLTSCNLTDNVVNEDVLFLDFAGKSGCTVAFTEGYTMQFAYNKAGRHIFNCTAGGNTTIKGGFNSNNYNYYNTSLDGNIFNFDLGDDSHFVRPSSSYYSYNYIHASSNRAESTTAGMGRIINIDMGKDSTFGQSNYPYQITAYYNIAGDCIFNLNIDEGGSTEPYAYIYEEDLYYNIAGDCVQRIKIPNGTYRTSTFSNVMYNVLTNENNHSLVHIVDAKVAVFDRSHVSDYLNYSSSSYMYYIGNSCAQWSCGELGSGSYPSGLGAKAGGMYISKGSTDLQLTAWFTRCSSMPSESNDRASTIYIEDNQYVTFPECAFYNSNGYTRLTFSLTSVTIGGQTIKYLYYCSVNSYNTLSSADKSLSYIRFGSDGDMIFDGSRFGYASGTNGGALSFTSGSAKTLTGCTFVNNSAVGDGTNKGKGGAIYSTIPLTLINCSFSGNYASGGQGGAIYCESDLTINNTNASSLLAINSNYAASGGAIYCKGNLTLNGLKIYGNYSSNGDGGAIYCEGATSINRCLFYAYGSVARYDTSSNSNYAGNGYGGYIYAKGNLSITDAFFGDGYSSYSGGAIFALGNVSLTGVGFNNCYTQNWTSNQYNGGAICMNDGTKTLSCTDVSFRLCYAYRGGAIYYPTTKTFTFTSSGNTGYSIYRACLWDSSSNNYPTNGQGEYAIAYNRAQIGGVLYTCGSVIVRDIILQYNFAYRGGDIVYIDVTDIADYPQQDKNIFVTLENCVLRENGSYDTSSINSSSSNEQGGYFAVNNNLLNSSNLGFTQTFNKCSFVSNYTSNKSQVKDGYSVAPIRVYNQGVATFTDCLFANNTSYGGVTNQKGGFIMVANGGTCIITGTGSDYKHPSVVGGNYVSGNSTVYCYAPSGAPISFGLSSRSHIVYGSFAYVAAGGTFEISNTTIGSYEYKENTTTRIKTQPFNNFDTNGVIYSEKNAIISVSDCKISGNGTNSHIFDTLGDISYTNCTFKNNANRYNGGSSHGGGAIYVRNGTIATIYNCYFDGNYENNSATTGGGAVRVYGRMIMLNSTITNSRAYYGNGGAICFESGSISTLSGVEICNNENNVRGGVLCIKENASVSITNCNIHDNYYGFASTNFTDWNKGLTIYNKGSLSITSTTFTNNYCGSSGTIDYSRDFDGSVLYSTGSANIKLSDITISAPSNGTALYFDGNPLVEIYNLNLKLGGSSNGIYCASEATIITDSHFDNGIAGNIIVMGLPTTSSSSLIISNCTFNNNETRGNIIYNGGRSGKKMYLSITDCEFSNNRNSLGDSISIISAGVLELAIQDCIFTNNNCNDGMVVSSVSDDLKMELTSFTRNTASKLIDIRYCSAVLNKVSFTDNTLSGTSIYYYNTNESNTLSLVDCTFTGNSATKAMHLYSKTPVSIGGNLIIQNNTFVQGAMQLYHDPTVPGNQLVYTELNIANGSLVQIEDNYKEDGVTPCNIINQSGWHNHLILNGPLAEGSNICASGAWYPGDGYGIVAVHSRDDGKLSNDYLKYFTCNQGYVLSSYNGKIIVTRIAGSEGLVMLTNDISYTVRNSDLTTTAYSVEPSEYIAYTNATYTGVEYYYDETWHAEAPTYNAVNTTGYTVSFRLVNGSEYIYSDDNETPFTFKVYIVPQSLHIKVAPTVIVLYGASFSTAQFRDYQVVNDNGNAVAGYWDFTNSSDKTKTVGSSNMSNSYSVTFRPYNTDVYTDLLSTSITLKVNYDKVYYRKNNGSNIGFYSTMAGSTKLSITTLSDMITYLNDYGKIVFSETYNVSADTNIVANKVIYFVRGNTEMPIFTVASGKSLSMSGGVGRIILDGLDVGAVQSGTHLIDNNGTTTLGNNIIIRNFVNSDEIVDVENDQISHGIIWNKGNLTLDGVEICDCTNAFGNGGAIYSTGVLVINGGEFHKNKAEKGGFVYSTGEIMLSGGAIRLNEAKLGGGIYANGGAIYLSAGEVKFNKAVNTLAPTTTSGGGIYAENCSITIGSTKIYSNSAYSDSGIGSGEEVTIINVSGEVYSSAAYINSQNITVAEEPSTETKHSALLLVAVYMSILLVVALTVLSKRPQKLSKKR